MRLRWQDFLPYVAFINICMPQIPGKDLIISLQEHVYYTILLYNLVSLKLWEGLYRFALITCFTMLPLSKIACFLDVWDILYYFTIFSKLLLYCMWLYYIFILLQIYYIANVSYNWVLFSVLHFYSIIFVSHILNIPYYFTLVMFFTILHFYWIEFVADLFWKDLIISS